VKKGPKREKTELDPRLRAIADKCQFFFDRLLEQVPEGNRAPMVRADSSASTGAQAGAEAQAANAIEPGFAADLRAMLCSAAQLPALAKTFSSDWPAQSRPVLPGNAAATRLERTWAPILAWIVVRSLPEYCIPNGDRIELFDRLLFRAMLADLFASMGMAGESSWQAAAEVRLLLSQAIAPAAIHCEALWTEPDVRWLAGVNQAGGITFFNREQFEELLTWLQLPALLQIAQTKSTQADSAQIESVQPGSAQPTGIAEIERSVAAVRKAAHSAGYNLKKFLTATTTIG
jgi:hypothetical protein